MTNDALQNVIINLTWFVMLLRLMNGIDRHRTQKEVRRHIVWTFGMSLVPWLILYLRLSISRNFELIAPFDPLATVAWALVLVGQGAGFVYEWMPLKLLRLFTERGSR